MAEDVVGLLEVVEIDAQHGEARAGCPARCSNVSASRSASAVPVRQIGQRIVMREMGDVFVPWR